MTDQDEQKKQAEKEATDQLAKQTKSDGPEAEEAAKKRGDAERKMQDIKKGEGR